MKNNTGIPAKLQAEDGAAPDNASSVQDDTTSDKIEHEPVVTAKRNPQLEALERILAGPKWNVMRDGRMPTAEERNARR